MRISDWSSDVCSSDLGERQARPERGLISRPSAETVTRYRRHLDSAMAELLESADAAQLARLAPLLELGFAPDQQHQDNSEGGLVGKDSVMTGRSQWSSYPLPKQTPNHPKTQAT